MAPARERGSTPRPVSSWLAAAVAFAVAACATTDPPIVEPKGKGGAGGKSGAGGAGGSGTGGSAGAGGQGGGVGGSGTGGSAGAGGGGGGGGTAGKGGGGGAGGQGGGGGYGGQGGGGGAGGSGGSGGANCGNLKGKNASCDACFKQSCCSEGLACSSNPDCISLLQCIQPCSGDPSCENSCANKYPNGVNALNALGQCMQTSCQAACQ